MRVLLIVLLASISCCCASLATPSPESETTTPAPKKFHELRRHYKRDHSLQLRCGSEKCPEDSMFIYYKCCRTRQNQCCWYLRMWVIVVFGAILVKAFLACFVSFFRCVCY